MRITKVSVKNLFGRFNHEIPIHESRITIIHGPNGFGKTILLTMVDGIFNFKLGIFYDIPFDEFQLDLNTDESIIIRKTTENDDHNEDVQVSETEKPDPDLCLPTVVYVDEQRTEDVVLDWENSKAYLQSIREVAESATESRRLRSRSLPRSTADSVVALENVIEAHDVLSNFEFSEDDERFLEIRDTIHTRLIRAQRLESRPTYDESSRITFSRSEVWRSPKTRVEECSDKILERIRKRAAIHEELSQSRDSSFPRRVMGAGGFPRFNQQLFERWQELEAKRMQLMDLGLLYSDEDSQAVSESGMTEGLTTTDQDQLANEFFSTFVDDTEVKLAVFDNIANQLQLLTQIINERFDFKKLRVSRRKGLVVIDDDGEDISLTDLSSGEQHEIILFYELLFEVKPDSMILIDEPELSLHVDWQQKFIDDIQRVTELRHFDVLLATHSPQIIWDKNELMVRLTSPSND